MTICLDVGPRDKIGSRRVIVKAGERGHRDHFNTDNAFRREKFLESVRKKCSVSEDKAVHLEREMLRLADAADECQGPSADGDGGERGDDKKRKPSQADELVKLTAAIELFHTPGAHDSEAYASIIVDGHRENWQVNTKGFRRWLARRFYETNSKTPSTQALQDGNRDQFTTGGKEHGHYRN